MQITAILPVSRTQYLDRVLESLLNQTQKPNNLLVIFDGPDKQFIEVRNKISELKFESVLCVKSRYNKCAFSIPERRVHIAGIHNHFRELIGRADWVFSIEDDGVLPANALSNLLKATKTDNVGMVTGVEVGRWGVRYIGAWRVDDVNNAREITSLENRISEAPLIEEIDACGLYCALIKADMYKMHEFTANNGLGADVNLGLFLRSNGYNNYLDWGVSVLHLSNRDGQELELDPADGSSVVKLRLLYSNIWQSYR